MISCKLVLANGNVVVASETENADLFWALRGAGHNFGVAVEATFRVHKQSNRGMHYTWDLEYELEQCDDVFRTLNEVTEVMPKELAIFVLWMRKSTEGKQVRGSVALNFPSKPADDLFNVAYDSSESGLVRP